MLCVGMKLRRSASRKKDKNKMGRSRFSVINELNRSHALRGNEAKTLCVTKVKTKIKWDAAAFLLSMNRLIF